MNLSGPEPGLRALRLSFPVLNPTLRFGTLGLELAGFRVMGCMECWRGVTVVDSQ